MKDKNNIEVKVFFDGTQSVTDAFALLIAHRIQSKKFFSYDIALKGNICYNTGTKGINCLPSGHAGD